MTTNSLTTNEKKEMTVGFFPMCADVLHAGHIFALKEAKQHCDYLIVGLNTHPDGKQPIQSVYQRFVQLSAVVWVDEVLPYQGKNDCAIMASLLDYQIRFLGEDYKTKPWDGMEQEKARGIKPYFTHRYKELSSTEIKTKISDAAKAQKGGLA